MARWALQRALRRRNWWQLLLIPPLLALLGIVLLVATIAGIVGTSQASCAPSSLPISAPSSDPATMKAMGSYLESQGFTPFAAAGTVGNLRQENGLNPSGDGIAQWGGAWKTQMQTWVTQHGGDPSTAGGQLEYVAASARDPAGAGFGHPYAGIWANLMSAKSAEDAAMYWQNDYEACAGVTPADFGTANANGGLCNSPNRKLFAAQALQAMGGSSSAVNVNLVTAGTCVAAVGSGNGDPIPGFTPGRDDMGVDACAKPSMPILAPARSTLVLVHPNWYAGQPLMLLQFNPPLAGTYQNDEYWYVAEQIVPVSTTPGTVFAAGQPVATFATSGTCIEIGWGSPSTNSLTLVPTDANPGAGVLTAEGEAFKTYFNIPWVGKSL